MKHRKLILLFIILIPLFGLTAQTEQRRIQFVFVTGLFSEQRPPQFRELSAALASESIFFPKTQMTILGPSSQKTVFENRPWLTQEIVRLYKESNGVPIVLVAHSKGAAEALASLIQEPRLLSSGIVAQVYLIQAALGSGLATATHYVCVQHQVPLELCQEPQKFANGLASIRGPLRDQILTEVKKMRPSDREHLHRSIRYVTSYATLRMIAGADRKLLYLALRLKDGRHDDAVPITHQVLPGIGSVLMQAVATHLTFVDNKEKSPERAALIKTLAHRIAMDLDQQNP